MVGARRGEGREEVEEEEKDVVVAAAWEHETRWRRRRRRRGSCNVVFILWVAGWEKRRRGQVVEHAGDAFVGAWVGMGGVGMFLWWWWWCA